MDSPHYNFCFSHMKKKNPPACQVQSHRKRTFPPTCLLSYLEIKKDNICLLQKSQTRILKTNLYYFLFCPVVPWPATHNITELCAVCTLLSPQSIIAIMWPASGNSSRLHLFLNKLYRPGTLCPGLSVLKI